MMSGISSVKIQERVGLCVCACVFAAEERLTLFPPKPLSCLSLSSLRLSLPLCFAYFRGEEREGEGEAVTV